ncbi:MAG: hypothetical protein ACKVOO_09780 [Burkholderiaceae bacterium]
MKERPILFSAPMVLALLDGTKTQTRRTAPIAELNIKPHTDRLLTWVVTFTKSIKGVLGSYSGGSFSDLQARSIIASQFNPYGKPGDQLWVRETWAQVGTMDPGLTVYRADYPACVPASYSNIQPAESIKWKPSIFMPRAASRITLEVTGVRVERLQDISEADAIAEGIESLSYGGITTWRNYSLTDKLASVSPMLESPIDSYRTLWECINGPGSWDANPWVWVVEFKRVKP